MVPGQPVDPVGDRSGSGTLSRSEGCRTPDSPLLSVGHRSTGQDADGARLVINGAVDRECARQLGELFVVVVLVVQPPDLVVERVVVGRDFSRSDCRWPRHGHRPGRRTVPPAAACRRVSVAPRVTDRSAEPTAASPTRGAPRTASKTTVVSTHCSKSNPMKIFEAQQPVRSILIRRRRPGGDVAADLGGRPLRSSSTSCLKKSVAELGEVSAATGHDRKQQNERDRSEDRDCKIGARGTSCRRRRKRRAGLFRLSTPPSGANQYP